MAGKLLHHLNNERFNRDCLTPWPSSCKVCGSIPIGYPEVEDGKHGKVTVNFDFWAWKKNKACIVDKDGKIQSISGAMCFPCDYGGIAAACEG